MTNKTTTVTAPTDTQEAVSIAKKTGQEKMEGELKRIPVDAIIPDPNQPRKTFYKISMEELVESIKANKENGGVLQSLLLRKYGDKYMIIFGERRWKAAVKASLKDVPAMIVEATDEKALSMQIIENLQRENLLPMEQANAFRQLAEKCKMNAAEIAVNMGKSEYFVRQQIKLTDLIPQWQKILGKQGIPVTIALQIAVLPEVAQKELYQNHVTKDDEKAERPIIQISQHTLNKYKGILSEACFDITDAALDAKMGACTNCPFNTACYSLFPAEQQTPRCNNITCFNNKTVIHLNREFNKAKDDPTVLLVYDAHSVPDYVKKMKSEGHEILKLGYADDCKEMKEPRKPDWEDFEKWAKKRIKSQTEIKKGFKSLKENYALAKEVYDKNIASGKYKKAFVVYDGDEKQTGKYVYVEMNPKKTTAKDAQKAIAAGNVTLEDVNNEITRLQEKEKRAIELDAIKIQEKIVQAVKEYKAFYNLPSVSRTDNALINFFLLESVSFSSRSVVEKIVRQPSSANLSQLYKWMESLSRQQVAFLIRQIILDKYGSSLPNTRGGFLLRKMAESLGAIPITTFEKEQKEKAKKRQQRLKERIDELNKHKQQLTKSNKALPAAKQKEKKEAAAA